MHLSSSEVKLTSPPLLRPLFLLALCDCAWCPCRVFARSTRSTHRCSAWPVRAHARRAAALLGICARSWARLCARPCPPTMVSGGHSRADAIDVDDADSESEVLEGSPAAWRAVKRVKREHKPFVPFSSTRNDASTSHPEPRRRPQPPPPELPAGFCLPAFAHSRRARSPSTGDDSDVPPLVPIRPRPRPGTTAVEPSPIDFHAEPRTDDEPATMSKAVKASWTAYARPGVPAQGFGTVRERASRCLLNISGQLEQSLGLQRVIH